MNPEILTMFETPTVSAFNIIMILGILVAMSGALHLRKSNKALHQRALKAQKEELAPLA